MRKTVFFASALLLLALPFSAFALSDADYKRFAKESPAFAAADKRLVQVWEKLRKALPKKDYENLLIEQRDWLQRKRDIEAKAESDAPTLAAAYAAVTERRSAALESVLAQKTGAHTPSDTPAAAPGVKAGEQSGAQPVGSPAAPKLTPSTALPHDKDAAATPLAGQGAATAPLDPSSRPSGEAPGQSGATNGAANALAPAPAAPAAFEGSYIMDDGKMDVRSAPGGFDVVVERRGPGNTWVCRATGRAILEGNTLILNDRDHPESAPIAIEIESNKMLITRSFPTFCAPGGTLGGVYVKTPAK